MTQDGRGIPLGRYLLTERLAIGGMGEVYLAIQRGMGAFEKPLALKLLLPHLTEDVRAVEMFLDEARVAARMNHQNIVQIFDVGLADQRYYLAMELVRGVSMSTLISALEKANVKLPGALLLYVARCLLEGLDHAHEMTGADGKPLHIVHRDVTPHNVLISEAGEVKLTDFGIAKTRDTASRTAPGTIKGKFEYIAPEQARGDEPDHRADLYSAGISLFHLATLQSPFRRDRDVQVIQAVMAEPLPSLAALRPDLPLEFVDMIRKLTAKSPRERPASAKAARQLLPPASTDEDPRSLGQVVRMYCEKTLNKLEQQTRHAAQMGEATRGLEPAEGEKTQDNVLPQIAARTVIYQSNTNTTNSGSARLRRVSIPLVLAASLLGSFLAVASVAILFKLTEGDDRPSVVTPPPRVLARPDAATEEAVVVAPTTVIDGGELAVEAEDEDVKETPKDEGRGGGSGAVTFTKPQLGYLYVDAVPWAKVSVAGKTIGETPIAKFPVERGFVQLVLHSPDTGKTVRKKVKVTAGKVTYVKEDLR